MISCIARPWTLTIPLWKILQLRFQLWIDRLIGNWAISHVHLRLLALDDVELDLCFALLLLLHVAICHGH